MHAAEAGVAVAEIISALSYALDLTEDAVPGHALRSCLLGMRIGQAIGLPESELSKLYYALMLKDVGCSSNAARLCQIIGADERQLKRAVKLEDWTKVTWSGVRTAWRSLNPEASVYERMQQLIRLGRDQERNNREIIELRCDRGASIISKIGLPAETAEAVRHLDEHWNGSGYPLSLKGEAIPMLARILLVAQHLDVFASERGLEAAIRALAERSGRWFDPELVKVARALHRSGTLWTGSGNEHAAALDMEPGEQFVADTDQIDAICEAFAEVVDVKSSFTCRHSRLVTDTALMIAAAMGLPAEKIRLVGRASLLHDLGKLRVPNSVLDKPGKLTPAEWQVVKEHPGLSRRILQRVHCFEELADVAGQHHEKLDGSGYPDGLKADQLSVEARIIAVADVYSALSEDRPYRQGLSLAEVESIMVRDVPERLDGDCFDALMGALRSAECGLAQPSGELAAAEP